MSQLLDDRRTAPTLGEAERDAIWQYADPIWPAHYAWHPEHGWLYCTNAMPDWRPTAAGHADVTTATITHGACGQRFNFDEICRYRAGHSIIFTPRGPIKVPDTIADTWPAGSLT